MHKACELMHAQGMRAHACTRHMATPPVLLHQGAPLQCPNQAAEPASCELVRQSTGSVSHLQGSLSEALCPRTGLEEPALVQLSSQLCCQGILVCQIACSAPKVMLSLGRLRADGGQ